ILALIGAGLLYCLLVLTRISPLGPVLASLLYFTASVWALFDYASLGRLLPDSVLGVHGAADLPLNGVSLVLAVPPLLPAVSHPPAGAAVTAPPPPLPGSAPRPPPRRGTRRTPPFRCTRRRWIPRRRLPGWASSSRRSYRSRPDGHLVSG